MRIIQEFQNKDLTKLVDDFYNYFEDGYKFEAFLKCFLEGIGLEEVAVTQRSRDGGVDLVAVRKGLSELNNQDVVVYKVQAKRNKPTSLIAPEKIDALRGNLKFNEKGLFITTARISEKAKDLAMTKDPTKPVIAIDGKALVTTCIEKQIGFAYKPIFSSVALDELMNVKHDERVHTADSIEEKGNAESDTMSQDTVSKKITQNDIRCHMISVPKYIIDNINNNTVKQDVKLIVNGEEQLGVKFCPSRNYLSGVTAILKKHKLMELDGSYIEKLATWVIDKELQIISIEIG